MLPILLVPITLVYERYIAFGWRKDPLGKDVAQYGDWKDDGRRSKRDQAELESVISSLAKRIEEITIPVVMRARRADCKFYDCLTSQTKSRTLAGTVYGKFTQLVIGKSYQSPAHTDPDCFYSALTCLPPENDLFEGRSGGPLYHFCFPEVRVAVPVCAGDIVVFNPLVYHCASNTRKEGSLILGFYASLKTYATEAAARKIGIEK